MKLLYFIDISISIINNFFNKIINVYVKNYDYFKNKDEYQEKGNQITKAIYLYSEVKIDILYENIKKWIQLLKFY